MFLILFFLASFQLSAAPQNIEVWFLSQDKKTALLRQIENPLIYSKPTVSRQCEPVGDYCFDPQFGLYKPENEWEAVSLGNSKEEGNLAPEGFDRDLIDCDTKNSFDIFCGMAKKEKVVKKNLEIWIDTSGSMKEFDFTDEHGGCYRKSLLTRLDTKCPLGRQLNVMVFDTSIKQIGTLDSLCHNNGLNSLSRMTDWIERSEVKNLIIITDINEYTKEFSDYLALKNAKIKGAKGDLFARSLLDEVSSLVRMCK